MKNPYSSTMVSCPRHCVFYQIFDFLFIEKKIDILCCIIIGQTLSERSSFLGDLQTDSPNPESIRGASCHDFGGNQISPQISWMVLTCDLVFTAGCLGVWHMKNQTCSCCTQELNTEHQHDPVRVQWTWQEQWLTEQGGTPSINL